MKERGDGSSEDGPVDPRAGVRAWLKALNVRVLGPLRYYREEPFRARVRAVYEALGTPSRLWEFECYWGGTIVTFGDRFVVNGVGVDEQFTDVDDVVVARLDDLSAVCMNLDEGYVYDGCSYLEVIPSSDEVADRSYLQWLLRWALTYERGEARTCSWEELCTELGELQRVDALSPVLRVWVGDGVLVEESEVYDETRRMRVLGHLVRRTEGRLPTALPEI